MVDQLVRGVKRNPVSRLDRQGPGPGSALAARRQGRRRAGELTAACGSC